MGEVTGIQWCFEKKYFLNPLKNNGLSREYIVEYIMMDEPVSWEHVESDKYVVIYALPGNNYKKSEF